MKKIGLLVMGITLVIGLLWVGPAGATATQLSLYGPSIVNGYSSYTMGGSLTISPGNDIVIDQPFIKGTLPAWTLFDNNDSVSVGVAGTWSGVPSRIYINGTTMTISGTLVENVYGWDGGLGKVTVTQSLLKDFSIQGTINSFSNKKGDYAWDVIFGAGEMQKLTNGYFTVAADAFHGTVGFAASGNMNVTLAGNFATVPVPSALLLLAPGLLALVGIRKRVKG